jgi:hypothetical protein
MSSSIIEQARAFSHRNKKVRHEPSSLQVGGMNTGSGASRPLNQTADADARVIVLPASADGASHITIAI